MVHVIEADMDASVTTLSCSHIHDSIGSYFPMCCSHVPTIVLMLHQTITNIYVIEPSYELGGESVCKANQGVGGQIRIN